MSAKPVARVILLLSVVLCSACAKDHTKPPANLDYLSVMREGNLPLYDIHYTSDIDVLDLFGRGEKEGVASANLQCALDDDQDFSVEHVQQLSAYGLIYTDTDKQKSQGYRYVTRTFLKKTSINGSSSDNLSVSELNRILSNKQSIPCKVVMTAYGYKPYYSNTMNLPVADLLREVNNPQAN